MNNKSFFLGLIVAIMWSVGVAQRPYYRPQVHEISVQLGAIHLLPQIAESKNQRIFALSPVNGLRYTYHFNRKTALRTGVFYRNQKASYAVSGGEAPATFDLKLFSVEGKIGVIRSLDLRKNRVYAGIDAIFAARNGIYENPMIDGAFALNHIGGGVLFGYKRMLSPNLSLAIENEFHITTSSSQSLFRNNSGFNLMQVLVSYHFKEMRKSCACGKPGS